MGLSRRDEILLHAARLFSEKGVAATTVRDIAEEVGILSGSLYHYFAAKDSIAYAIVIAFIDDLNAKYERAKVAGESARERLDRMVAASFEAAIAHPYATEIYQNEGLAALGGDVERMRTAVEVSNRHWAGAVAQGVSGGELRADVDAAQFHRMLRESVWTTVRFNRVSLPELADQLRRDTIAVFLDGFTARADAPDPEDPLAKLQHDVVELQRMLTELRDRA
ncbi:TetR/AcrR family transcriptional regulator [Tomitella biformata]|uniref:TetR/AcrR family transcriptional regulator n=1 Tax=Tomitella biformata TaxID=630403 RepID=UPI0004669D11|nr:TetR/AcrR family transcriptional regulator [Tomitella biformata]